MGQNVFKTDHSLPTMSIDDYLTLEKSRGGILDAQASMTTPQANDEDDEKFLECQRKKDIDWDTFSEENSKGSGNTMNRG